MIGYEFADGTLVGDVKVGDKFIANENFESFRKGDIVELVMQDGSDCPAFESPLDWHFCYWRRLMPIKKQFTKSDLKDGMRAIHADGTVTIVVGRDLWVVSSKEYKVRSFHIEIDGMTPDLLSNLGFREFDIMKVVDRDGTILFEREETPVKSQQEIEMEKLQKQIDELQAQAAKLKASMK